jgi:hypothetical protein
MFDCHLTMSLRSSINLTFPSWSRGTDCRHCTPNSAGTIGRAPEGNAAMAILTTAQGSCPEEADEGLAEFKASVELEVVVLFSAAAIIKSTSACVMTSFMSRSGYSGTPYIHGCGFAVVRPQRVPKSRVEERISIREGQSNGDM